jgi:hypothetical protein
LGCSVFNDNGRKESFLPLLDDVAIYTYDDFLVFYIRKIFRTYTNLGMVDGLIGDRQICKYNAPIPMVGSRIKQGFFQFSSQH